MTLTQILNSPECIDSFRCPVARLRLTVLTREDCPEQECMELLVTDGINEVLATAWWSNLTCDADRVRKGSEIEVEGELVENHLEYSLCISNLCILSTDEPPKPIYISHYIEQTRPAAKRKKYIAYCAFSSQSILSSSLAPMKLG